MVYIDQKIITVILLIQCIYICNSINNNDSYDFSSPQTLTKVNEFFQNQFPITRQQVEYNRPRFNVKTDIELVISVAVNGDLNYFITTDLIKNILYYTNDNTYIVIHVSSTKTRLDSRQFYDEYGNYQRLIINPRSIHTRKHMQIFNDNSSKPEELVYILLAHLSNYHSLYRYGFKTQHFMSFAKNSRLIQPGIECYVKDKLFFMPWIVDYQKNKNWRPLFYPGTGKCSGSVVVV